MVLHYLAACSFTEILFIIISACGVCVCVYAHLHTLMLWYMVIGMHVEIRWQLSEIERLGVSSNSGSSGLCNKHFHPLSHLPSNGDLVLVAISYYPSCLEVIRDFGNSVQMPELSYPCDSKVYLCLWTIDTWVAPLYICDDFLCQATLRGRLLSQTSAITLLHHPALSSESMNFSQAITFVNTLSGCSTSD